MANEWNKTAFVEFETMLRRHLRSGAAPVAACAGFDIDTASSYLEGALGGSERAGYESHLAGCAICRRHLIELARLAQTAPRAETQPVTAPDRIPAWNRWKGAVAVWFELSSRNFKWRMAGAAGAAFAILIALVAQSWRQASNYADVEATASATPPISVGPGVQPPTVEPSPQDTLSVAATNSSATQHMQSQVPAPIPHGEPKANAPEFAVLGSHERLSLSEPSEAPVARPDGAEARRDPSRQPSDFVVGGDDSSRASRSVLDFRESAREVAKETQGLRINPLPKDNPMNLEPSEPDLNHETPALGRMHAVNSKPESGPKPPDTPSSGISLGSIAEAIKGRFYPSRKSSFSPVSERKTKPDKREEPKDESPKPMQVMIRDKIFCFEKCKGPDLEKIRGMWIDREYDFEKQKWNVWTMKSGDELYKQVLAREPLLKEFFDHRPILIVWKNRIYKVLK